MDCQANLWNGSPLGPGPISLFLCSSDSGSSGTDPVVMFGAASDGEVGVGLLREQLGSFFRQHRDQTIVCYDAAELHWLLHDLFAERRDQEVIELLWACSRDCRLFDLAILDQHVRRITEGNPVSDRLPLSRLVERYTGDHFPGAKAVRQVVGTAVPATYHDFDLLRLTLPIRAALALTVTHRQLDEAVQRIQESLQAAQDSRRQPPVSVHAVLPPPTTFHRDTGSTSGVESCPAGPRDGFESPRKFGPLGVGLDVMRTIAFQQAERVGLAVNGDLLPEVARRSQRLYVHASKALHADNSIANEITWTNNDQIARGGSGQPQYGRALTWTLERKRKELVDAAGYSALLPPAEPNDWRSLRAAIGVWARSDRELGNWCDLLGAADVLHFTSGHASETARPGFHVQPSVYSSRPDLRVVSDLAVPLFRPRQDQKFLLVHLPDLRLRCFAALCREWYGAPAAGLYSIVRASKTPAHVLADRLYQHQRNGYADAMNDEFAALQRNHPEEHRQWIRLAQSLVGVLPLGLPYELAGRILEREFGLAQRQWPKWEELSKLLVRTIVPELRNFLDHDPAQPVAENQGKSESDVRADLGLKPWQNVYNRDRYDPSLLHTWKKLGGDRTGRDGLGNTGDLKTILEGIGGRVTSRWYTVEVRRQAWLMLVDDVLKRVAYAVVARGFQLLAVAGQDLLLEVASDRAGEASQEVESICERAARELLREAKPGCTIQVRSAWPESESTLGVDRSGPGKDGAMA